MLINSLLVIVWFFFVCVFFFGFSYLSVTVLNFSQIKSVRIVRVELNHAIDRAVAISVSLRRISRTLICLDALVQRLLVCDSSAVYKV